MVRLVFLCLLSHLRTTSCRSWRDLVGPGALADDGMPRASPPRNRTAAGGAGRGTGPYESLTRPAEIDVHGVVAGAFDEADVYRVTETPSAAPSWAPSSAPSGGPSSGPSSAPSGGPSVSAEPTLYPTVSPVVAPTGRPTYEVATVPSNPNPGYFNYDDSSIYGPRRWKNIQRIERGDPGFFWHTFDLPRPVTNDCGSGKRQSPIDLCTRPRESCTETHEMRPKSGDYRMDSDFITKVILPNKLRLVMAPRTGEEPDPPQIDFSSNGQGITDMTHIEIKFPSEHTVCGRRFDGEMQYFTFHPFRKRFVAVAFFLDASEGNPRNEHMQEVIDVFTELWKDDQRRCRDRGGGGRGGASFASSFANGGRALGGDAAGPAWGANSSPVDLDTLDALNSTLYELLAANDEDAPGPGAEGGGRARRRRRLMLKWHPFHPDVQRTVHFWGYKGSPTEPPCTSNSVDWKVMDVPTPISPRQMAIFRHLLLAHVDGSCRRTSVHGGGGTLARPTQVPDQRYYKCTRDDYVSDEERAVCGDAGCRSEAFGAGLNPYYEPIVHVTGPPTRSPSK